MKTIVMRDDGFAERLSELARESRRPFKAVLNDALRDLGGAVPRERKFVLKAHRGNLRTASTIGDSMS